MSKTAIIADYMVAFVSEFAKIYRLTETQAFRYLWRYGAIEDITNCYEAAHTLSFEDVCQTAAEICKSRTFAVSPRIRKLRGIAKDITKEQIEEDDRLAYIMSK